MTNGTNVFQSQREQIQKNRRRFEHKEAVKTAVRMVRSALDDRADRVARDAASMRSDDDLVGHLGTLLSFHGPGQPNLGYLRDDLISLTSEFETDYPSKHELLKLDSMDRSEALPYVLLEYVEGDANRTDVEDAFRQVLATDEFGRVEALVWLFDEHLHGMAHDELEVTRGALEQARENHVTYLGRADDPQSSFDPFDALDWTEPVAMLPVRMETRFADAHPQGGALHVRAYPDQVQVDSHEEELTEAEYDWGTAFWAQVWFLVHEFPSDLDSTTTAGIHGGHPSGDERRPDRLPDDRLRSVVEDLFGQVRSGAFSDDAATRFEEVRDRTWQRGVEQFGTERAAYVVHTLSPTGGDEGDEILAGPDPSGSARPSPEPLRFPSVRFRPESWTKPPRARLLPDRWIVYAYWEDQTGTPDMQTSDWSTEWQSVDGNSWRRWDPDRELWVKKITGRAIREPLQIGPNPEDVTGRPESGSGPVEEGMDWMIADDSDESLQAARNAGMVVSFANPDDGTWRADAGYETLVLTGLRTSGVPERTADELSDLLDAHHYTDGLDFLKQGTPTNNADESSGQSEQPDPAASAPVEAGAPLLPVDGAGARDDDRGPLGSGTIEADGTRLARALGIDADTFAHVEHADTLRHLDAGHVNDALWPATWEYYVKHFLVPDSWGTVIGGVSAYGGDDQEWFSGAEQDPGTLLLAWLAKYREHFRDHVRGSGPFQTLQVSSQPYGVLPVTALDVETDEPSTASQFYASGVRWDSEGYRFLDPDEIGDDRFLAHLVEQIVALRSIWLDAAEANVPKIGEGDLTDQRLLDLLSMEANASTLRRQSWLLGETNAVWRLYDDDFEFAAERYQPPQGRNFGGDDQTDAVERNLAHVPDLTDPRIGHMRFLGQSGYLSDEDDLVDDGIRTFLWAMRNVLDDGLYDLLGFSPGSRWLDRVRAMGGYWRDGTNYVSPSEGSMQTPVVPTPLSQTWGDLYEFALLRTHPGVSLTGNDLTTYGSVLRQLLHFATLREIASSRIRLGVLYDDVLDMDPDPSAYRGTPSIYDELRQPLGGDATTLSNHRGLQSAQSPEYADAIRTAADPGSQEIDPYVHGFAQHLDHLSALSPETLEDLTMETLSLGSHRLDGWWTSVATRRLWNVREASSTDDGVYVGAYGYVEDLTVETDESGEYLLAPSQNQVTTAAVLRSAHKEQTDEHHLDALAVDLSSDRVRAARSLLDGVRNGLALSDLLGYRFERRLRERGARSDTPGLMRYLDAFRQLAPSRAGKADRGGNDVPEPKTKAAASRDTVDGLALYRAWKSGNIDWGGSLPGSGSPARDEVEAIFERIDDEMDAVNDVLTAEAVHQLSMGNPDRATAALEGLSRGKQLPEPEILRTPREEVGATNRLLVLFGDAEWRDETTDADWDTHFDLRDWAMEEQDLIDPSTDLPGGSNSGNGTDDTAPIGVRHRAEPNLNAWVGELLPQPGRIRCPAEYQWSEDRQFARGTFEVPTEPGVVTVDDPGFTPDVLVFTVSTTVDGDGDDGDPSAYGWTHGKYHHRDDGDTDRNAMSLVVDTDRPAVEHASTTDRAIQIELPGSGGDATTIQGSVAETTDDGFTVRFRSTGATSPVVQYQAFETGDSAAVRVGHFTTPDADSAPETQTVDFGTESSGTDRPGDVFDDSDLLPDPDLSDGVDRPAFDPDHVLFTASTVIKNPDDSGTAASRDLDGSLVGFSYGEAVRTESGIDQRAIATANDLSDTENHAVSLDDNAAITLPYGSGSSITSASSATVTELGRDTESDRPRADLKYDSPDDEVPFGGFPRLVTYVAMESPTTEDPVETDHPPAIGQFTAPGSAGETVTETLGFEPACIEFRVCPSVTDESGSADALTVRTTTGAAGWSHGAATSVTSQGSLSQVRRPTDGTTAMAAETATSAAITLVHTADDGSVAGRDVGRLTSVDDEGFSVTFPEVFAPSGDESRPIVLYRAWPREPDERAFAVEDAVTLEALDLSPLDAVALSQVDAQPGLSQLERRLQYYLFRHRPDYRPSIPDDADIELTFAETGSDEEAHVSFAQYLELARSIREVLGDGRAATADDLAHPSEATGPGYLPADKADESKTASELRKRATWVSERLQETKAIVEDRVDLLDAEDGQTVLESVDDVQAALEAFGRQVPAAQLHTVAGRLNRAHNPGAGNTLVGELETLLGSLRAGPAAPAAIDDDVYVRAVAPDASGSETERTIELETEFDDAVIDVTVRSLSPSEYFDAQSETVRTDSSGAFTASFDFDDVVPGTRFVIEARLTDLLPPLGQQIEDLLRDVRGSTRAELFESLRDSRAFSTRGVDVLDEVFEEGDMEEFAALSTDEQVRLFGLANRDAHLEILDQLDRDDLLEEYAEADRPSVFVATGRVAEREGAGERDALAEALETDLTLLPLVLWLDRIVDDVNPSNDGSVGAELSAALNPQQIDWGRVGTEETLMTTVQGLTSPSAFGPEDVDAVRRLLDLQGVNLATLATAMSDVVEPLRRVGLTDYVERTGDRERPERQRYWRRPDCEVGAVWDRHCEGSVRARVRSFTRAPDWAGVPPSYQRFAPEFQRFVEGSSLNPDQVFGIEEILGSPTAFVHAAAPHLDHPAQLVYDLHDLVYHPDRFDTGTSTGDLATRLRTFGIRTLGEPFASALEPQFDVDALQDLGGYLLFGGANQVAQFATSAPSMLPDQRAATIRSNYERDTVAPRLGPTQGSQTPSLLEATEANLERRILRALAAGDLARSFRTGVLESLRRGLLRASYFGIYGSTPNSAAGGSPEDADTLRRQGESVLEELRARDEAAPGGQPATSVEAEVDRLQSILGDEFRVLPPFAPTNPAELQRTFAASDDLLDGDPYAVDTWLQRIARLRERPSEFRQMLTYADVFDLAAGDARTVTGGSRDAIVRRSVTVGQLPLGAGSSDDGSDPSWIGLDDVTPSGGDLALAAQFVTEADNGPVGRQAGSPAVAGLFLDEWVEKIPERERTLGVGVNYDDPDVRAPQSILLAVPPAWKRDTVEGFTPTDTPTWSMDLFRTTLEETTDLVQARSVDLDALGSLGHVLPALCFAYNEDTASSAGQELFLPEAPSVLLDAFDWISLD